MIKDVVIHMQNEQPLKADVERMPTATDACLLCTNLRSLNGTKPRWSDHIDSWFMIPLSVIRFVEIPRTSLAGLDGIIPLDPSGSVEDESRPFEDLEPDADLLRRIREA